MLWCANQLKGKFGNGEERGIDEGSAVERMVRNRLTVSANYSFNRREERVGNCFDPIQFHAVEYVTQHEKLMQRTWFIFGNGSQPSLHFFPSFPFYGLHFMTRSSIPRPSIVTDPFSSSIFRLRQKHKEIRFVTLN